MFAPFDPGRAGSEYLIQREHESVGARGPLDRAVDAERNPTGIPKNAEHLSEPLLLIGEELQSELTQNHVKAVARERQVQRAPLHPSNWRSLTRYAAGDG